MAIRSVFIPLITDGLSQTEEANGVCKPRKDVATSAGSREMNQHGNRSWLNICLVSVRCAEK
jgi:hypothetical protein